MTFQVGDKVRRISRSGTLNLGDVYEVERLIPDGVELVGYRGAWDNANFELVEAAPPVVNVEKPKLVRYCVIYREGPEGEPSIAFKSSAAGAASYKQQVEAIPGLEVLAMKKLSISY